MRILAILGSPRVKGNTDILLEKSLEAAKEKNLPFKKIVLNELNIRPCQECDGCHNTGKCVISDDMALLYEALDNSDRIIVASPIFFGNVSSQTKIMVDRIQCFWARKYLLKTSYKKRRRKGIFLACGYFKKEEYFNCASIVIDIFFKMQDIEFADKFFAAGIGDKGEVLKHPEMITRAYEIGKELIQG